MLEQQDRQFLDVSQMSTFLLSNRPSFITKSCHLLTCVIAMDGEEWVAGGWVKRGRLRACQQVVDGYLRGSRDLQLLEVRLVVLLPWQSSTTAMKKCNKKLAARQRVNRHKNILVRL